MGLSINKEAMKIVKEMIEESDKLGVKVIKMDCGATLIDCGLKVKGSFEAGVAFTKVTLGNLGTVNLGNMNLDDDTSFSAVELFVTEPLISCLGSQIAGWQVSSGNFATIGSGPARAQAGKDTDIYLDMTPYRDRNDEVVLCIQDIKYPEDDIALKVAEDCKVKVEDVYLLLAPSACIVGSIQVAARMLEQVCHKMHEKGFDVNKVVSCRGIAPIAPVVNNEVKAMGRINDAILYGGSTEFWVEADDVECQKVVHQLVSNTSSPYYPTLFEKVFADNDCDFYKIDHDFHSIAKIQLHSTITGKCFFAGEINKEVIKKSFLS